MCAVIIKVNDKEYSTYKELCSDLEINYGTLMKIRAKNPSISQYDLLRHFYKHVLFRLTDQSYLVSKDSKKPDKISIKSLFGWR